jgi:hypothetical protein
MTNEQNIQPFFQEFTSPCTSNRLGMQPDFCPRGVQPDPAAVNHAMSWKTAKLKSWNPMQGISCEPGF